MMKHVTYPEEFLLGRVQFFFCGKFFLQNAVSKKHMDYGEVLS